MVACNKAPRLYRRGLIVLSLIAALAAVAIGMLLWQAVELSSLAGVSQRVDQAKPLASGLRIGLIVLMAIFWPRLSFLHGPLGTDNDISRTRWMALRWRVIGWIIVIELVVGQNVFGRFFSVAASTT